MIKSIFIPLIGLTAFGFATDFYYEGGQKIEVTKLYESRSFEHNDSIRSVEYYKTSRGHKVGVVNEILVQCKSNVNCEELLKKHDVLAVTALSDTIFLVSISEDKNVFEMSQGLYEDSGVEIAHPNFVKEKRRR